MKPEILFPQDRHVVKSGKEYDVAVTRYPTTYGANRDIHWTRATFTRQCHNDVYGPYGVSCASNDPNEVAFVHYQDAVTQTQEIRNEKEGVAEFFTDHTTNQ
mmetsp:Transcript_26499/g.30277  ORF Transcript_26499/g.30277 Transcript_26499/m.30277 type:complete len:102 (-) Transcript_26499:76-381(-)